MNRIVALLTDFGLADGFVAACHGVVARTAPGVRVLDVTHEVPPGDIRRGAAVAAQTLPYLPPAVLVAVVDPGVGTARRAIALEAGEHLLVGPDNGLLGWAAAAAGGTAAAYELAEPALMLARVSRTFHGRDVFAPVAAHLAAGTPVADVGPAVDPAGLVRLPDPVTDVRPGELAGEVLTVDRYGNLQTALPAGAVAAAGIEPGDALRVTASGRSAQARQAATFGGVPAGGWVVYVDSADLVAVGVNGGSAARELAAGAGDLLRITRVAPGVRPCGPQSPVRPGSPGTPPA